MLRASGYRRPLSASTSDEGNHPLLGVLTAAEQYEPAQAATRKMRAVIARSTVWRAASTSSQPARLFSTSATREATWGFIGLGAMGYPMAKNLRAKIPNADTLIVCDTNPNATKKFVEEVGLAASSADAPGKGTGVYIAENPKDVAQKADTIITVLPEPQHVKSVFEAILDSTLPPAPTEESRLFIDCSTIDPLTSRDVASLVHNHSHQSRSPTGHPDNAFVDAPMSGGVVGARAGGLTFMVGAGKELMPRLEPILLLMGKKVWHMGPQGAGLSGKLANNYALAINNIAAAEAMNLGIKWGLEPKALATLINSATGKSWPSEINNPVPGVIETAPASRDYEGGFGVSLMKKDLRLAITAAKEAGAKLALAETARDVYEETEKAYKGKDFSVVYRWLGGKE